MQFTLNIPLPIDFFRHLNISNRVYLNKIKPKIYYIIIKKVHM